MPRGNGKSYGAAAVGLWRLLFGKAPQDIIGAALDHEGAKIILTHAKAIVRLVRELGDFIDRIISI